MESSTSKRCLRWALSMLVAFAMSTVVAFAQTKTVGGTIVDDLGEPILGANVVIEGTTTGVTTDMDGKFTLKGVPENAKLKITFIGYAEQIIPVAGQTQFSITLKEDMAQLDDVVVIGYGTVKRRDLTGSVASIGGDKLKLNPVSNVAQALQGMLPGVSVTAQDGRPGATMSIRVRGGNSVTQSNEPLYIVDGNQVSSIDDIPADNIESMDVLKDASTTAIYGSRGANGVILITTKGAKEGKCVVRYGGYFQSKKNATELDVMNAKDYIYWNWAYAQDYNFTAGKTAAEFYGSTLGQAVARTYGLGSAYGNHYDEYGSMSAHNYVDDLMRTAHSWNHEVSVSGGTEKTKIYASFNYLNDEGIRIQSGFNRVSANLKVDQKINKALSVDFDVRYNARNYEGSKFELATQAYRYRPIDNPLGDGDYTTWGNATSNMEDARNPLTVLDSYADRTKREGVNIKTGLSWQIIKGMKLRSELALGRNWVNKNNWYDGQNVEDNAYSSLKQTKEDGYFSRFTNTLAYEIPGLDEDHSVNILLGQETIVKNTNKNVFTGYGYPKGYTIKDAMGRPNVTGYGNNIPKNDYTGTIDWKEKTSSSFARLNYSYKGRYLVTGTVRLDGTNKFDGSKRWGIFPSTALAWRISDEAFMENTKDVLDNLKLRVSYGTVGNDNVPLYLGLPLMEPDNIMVDGVSTIIWKFSENKPTKDLEWEKTVDRNLGLDFSFLNGVVRGSVETYYNTTDNNLFKVPVSQNTGYKFTYRNVGETSNKGVEVNLTYDIVRSKDFNLSVNATYNYNKNNVDKIKEDAMVSTHTSWGSTMRIPYYDYIVEVGRPVGLIQGFKSAGYYTVDDFDYNAETKTYTLKAGIPDQRLLNYSSGVSSLADKSHKIIGKNGEDLGAQNAFPGAMKFEDTNGDGVVDVNDVQIIGEAQAKHTGGFGINANYKWFDLTMNFAYQIGGKVYNANAMYSMMGNKDNSLGQNRIAAVSDCFKNYAVNGSGDLELVTDPDQLRSINRGTKYGSAFSEYGVVSSEFVEDASYLRLTTLTVGYTVPAQLTKKVGISNARVYFTGGNLFCLTGYSGMDPDVNTNPNAGNDGFPTPNYDYNAYPKARTFTVGVNVTF
ncbi:MAG: TonB-dependent receptor [Bacteroidales bacterium]|nr:TonB-dependent receptor [Bacteroidales bacterium]